MYTILPFQFKRFGYDVLLVSECGDFLFLPKQDFDLFVRHLLDKNSNKKTSFVICTNLIGINGKQLHCCKEHDIAISTILDGTEEIHNTCRVTSDKKGTYSLFTQKLKFARSILDKPVDALMTTSKFSVLRLKEVIDEYIRLDFGGIFIRSLNPYGYAAEQADKLSYAMDDFVDYYLDVLNYIIKFNKTRFFHEYFATLLFSRILTPFATGFVNLQSPSGAGISGVIYDYDGSVYSADETRMLARMGDSYFCLGNVYKTPFRKFFQEKNKVL